MCAVGTSIFSLRQASKKYERLKTAVKCDWLLTEETAFSRVVSLGDRLAVSSS